MQDVLLQVVVASRLPGEFLSLAPACDAIRQVPFAAWDVEGRRAGRPPLGARFGGWLADVAAFDAGLFGISAPEAQLMDPQQRLLLEVCQPGSFGKRPQLWRHASMHRVLY